MKQTRFHGQFFTIPNILSYFRFLLIPVFLWLYCFKHSYIAAALVMAISGATDVVDGWIARHFHLVTDWGKIIDPFADKLPGLAISLGLGADGPFDLQGILYGLDRADLYQKDHPCGGRGMVWQGRHRGVLLCRPDPLDSSRSSRRRGDRSGAGGMWDAAFIDGALYPSLPAAL